MLSRKPSKFNQYPTLSPVDYRFTSDSVVILPRDYNKVPQKLTYPGSQYRNSRTGTRTTRTQIDHDVFEGLPIRHWRKRPISVNAAPEKENIENTDLRNLAWKELPMPRDAHLLSAMSQDLLRAARMPQAKKPTTPLLEDDKEPGDDEDADGEVDTGFIAKRWALLQKEFEGPEPEFLAKRRKGLPSVHNGAPGAMSNTGQMRKTKIRKVDTEGNGSVWEVLVPEGQTVEGEVVEEETSTTQALAPGTVVEGVGVVNAEGVVIAGDQGTPPINTRRPPPPKRRAKGPGRGRKKRVAFVGADGAPTANGPDGIPQSAVKTEEANDVRAGQAGQDGDTEMGDESIMKEGDQEGEEGSEEGSEDDEGEEGDREEGELSPSPSVSRSPTKRETPAIVESTQFAPILSNLPQFPPKMALLPATHFPPHQSDEPVTVPSDEHKNDASHDVMAESIDEMLDEPMDVMLDEPTNEMLDEPVKPSMLETTDLPTTSVPALGTIETSTKIETQPPWEVPVIFRGGDVAEAMESTENPTTEAIPVPVVEAESLSITETVMEPPVSASASTEPTTTHLMEPAMPLPTETVVKPKVEPTTESHVPPAFEAMQDTRTEAVEDLTKLSEQTADATVELMAEPFMEEVTIAEEGPCTEAMTMTTPIPEAMPEPILQNPVMAITVASTEAMMDSVAEPIAEPLTERHPDNTSQADREPILGHVNQLMPEPVPERKYSHARPTSSPKAPTPSPPTPIEITFPGLQAPQAPYLSPRAPTMSPPTPIDRGLSGSPDLPLSPRFQLPPQIDAAQEADRTSPPHTQQNPNPFYISVEAAPQVDTHQKNAQIPIEHDSLDGVAEPTTVVARSSYQNASADKPAQFEDGEEDLLGSLERSLGR